MTKILIIEDETQTRNVFLRCLEIEGFETCAASNALDGLDLAFSEQPDLIVCDILMPDQTGYFVLSKLRRSPQTAKVRYANRSDGVSVSLRDSNGSSLCDRAIARVARLTVLARMRYK